MTLGDDGRRGESTQNSRALYTTIERVQREFVVAACRVLDIELGPFPEQIGTGWDAQQEFAKAIRAWYSKCPLRLDVGLGNTCENPGYVTNMGWMFEGASSFSQELNKWNVSNVVDIREMFLDATSFNQPLNKWNVSNVTSMRYMFMRAESFNQPLNKWNVSNVTDVFGMFNGATSFNQPLYVV